LRIDIAANLLSIIVLAVAGLLGAFSLDTHSSRTSRGDRLMNAKRAVAAAQLLLMFPAILFMGALVARQVSPLQHEPAHTAGRIIMWYAARMWTLWALLVTLPLAVLVTGCVTLLRSWSNVPELHRTRQGLAAMYADRPDAMRCYDDVDGGVVLAIVAMQYGR